MKMQLAVVVAGLGAVVSLSACAPVVSAQSPPGATATSVAPAAPATSSTATATPPSATGPAPGATTPPATHFYADARAEWQQGADAISAQQGVYWLKAADDLQSGEATDGGDTSGYPKAIDELKNLASLPDAQQTPAQNAQYHADIDGLNSFFGTPGLYS